MILTNYQVSQLYESLCEVRDLKDLYIPVRTGFKILKNLQALEDNYRATEILRQKILLEYGEVAEDGMIRVASDRVEQVNKELDELANMKSDFNIATIQLEEIENLPLTLNTLNQLYLIIDGE